MRLTLLLVLFLFICIDGQTQFSIGVNAGYHFGIGKPDSYRLDRPWPDNSQGSSQVAFFDEATGITTSVTATWEATKHFGVLLDFSSVSHKLPVSKRTAQSTHLGAGIKINFRSNEQNVVPYIQLVYMFSNVSKLKQKEAFNGTGAYKQPAIDFTFKTALGVGIDAGVEFKVGNAIHIMPHIGFRMTGGTSSAESNEILSNLVWSTTSPTGVKQPSWFETAISHFHLRVGAKYYFSKRKKKRDF